MFSVISRILIIGAFIIASCSSINETSLLSDNLNEAISEVEALREDLKENQIDLLAYDQFYSGEERLEKAVYGFKKHTRNFREGRKRFSESVNDLVF